MSDHEIRKPAAEEIRSYARAVDRGFGGHSPPEEMEDFEGFLRKIDLLGAFDGSTVVGTMGAVDFQTNVPDGRLPTAGITVVTVQSTHHRRGILTQMMRQMLEGCRERGRTIASLIASETPIYGRFGYGLAMQRDRYKIDRSEAVLIGEGDSSGSVRLISLDEAAGALPAIFDEAGADRPGWISREKSRWKHLLKDPEFERHGDSALHCALYEDASTNSGDGQPGGYMLYRRTGDGRKDIRVVEAVAASDEASAALWGFCFGIDLGEEITAGTRPVDDPLPWMLGDMRALDVLRQDWIWTRILDVPAVLASRGYSSAGELTLKISDEFLGVSSGTYTLGAEADSATCAESSGSPDLEMNVADLASIYFGGVRPSVLERAGRIEARSDAALKMADAMFATRKAPWNVVDF